MSSVITLTTDFGLKDGYVAGLKGVILSINPEAIIVDITHLIAPQNILQAAFVLHTIYPYFPKGTIHVAVVDPGVGSNRRAILLRTESAYCIAPDNGVLSYIIYESCRGSYRLAGTTSAALNFDGTNKTIQSVAITNSKYWLNTVSSTFHGRDIFAPVAAYLSLGLDYRVFGEPTNNINTISIPRPYVNASGDIIGQILNIDSFGNLITNIKNEDIAQKEVQIEVKGQMIEGLSQFYVEKQGLIALVGSSGHLEISLSNGNAADLLEAKIEDRIKVLVSRY
jgi:S-adenosylmethionine hydrolase